jgi:Tfp pilus assembly protein PilP
MNIILNYTRSFIAIFCMILLFGCNGNNEKVSEIKQKLESIKEAAVSSQTKDTSVLAATPTHVVYKYQSVSKELSAEQEKDLKDAYKGPINPLTENPVSSYEYLGILKTNDQVYGYVMAPNNFVYDLNVGDKLGSAGGRITKITTDYIEVSLPSKLSEKTPASDKKILRLKE